MSQDSRSLKRISTYSEKYLCFLYLEFFEYFVSAPFFILSSLLTADIPFHNKGKMNKFPTLVFIRTLFLCFQHISSRIHQLICSPGQLAIENICGLSIDFSPYFTEKVLKTISIFFGGGGGGGRASSSAYKFEQRSKLFFLKTSSTWSVQSSSSLHSIILSQLIMVSALLM